VSLEVEHGPQNHRADVASYRRVAPSIVPAILKAWEPGCFGGQAVAEILFGAVNPSGRLPISIPRGVGHIQTVYSHKPSQSTLRYVIGETGPHYDFGH
jgi:beta-glucosidase